MRKACCGPSLPITMRTKLSSAVWGGVGRVGCVYVCGRPLNQFHRRHPVQLCRRPCTGPSPVPAPTHPPTPPPTTQPAQAPTVNGEGDVCLVLWGPLGQGAFARAQVQRPLLPINNKHHHALQQGRGAGARAGRVAVREGWGDRGRLPSPTLRQPAAVKPHTHAAAVLPLSQTRLRTPSCRP
jgi:hypothetical protein